MEAESSDVTSVQLPKRCRGDEDKKVTLTRKSKRQRLPTTARLKSPPTFDEIFVKRASESIPTTANGVDEIVSDSTNAEKSSADSPWRKESDEEVEGADNYKLRRKMCRDGASETRKVVFLKEEDNEGRESAKQSREDREVILISDDDANPINTRGKKNEHPSKATTNVGSNVIGDGLTPFKVTEESNAKGTLQRTGDIAITQSLEATQISVPAPHIKSVQISTPATQCSPTANLAWDSFFTQEGERSGNTKKSYEAEAPKQSWKTFTQRHKSKNEPTSIVNSSSVTLPVNSSRFTAINDNKRSSLEIPPPPTVAADLRRAQIQPPVIFPPSGPSIDTTRSDTNALNGGNYKSPYNSVNPTTTSYRTLLQKERVRSPQLNSLAVKSSTYVAQKPFIPSNLTKQLEEKTAGTIALGRADTSFQRGTLEKSACKDTKTAPPAAPIAPSKANISPSEKSTLSATGPVRYKYKSRFHPYLERPRMSAEQHSEITPTFGEIATPWRSLQNPRRNEPSTESLTKSRQNSPPRSESGANPNAICTTSATGLYPRDFEHDGKRQYTCPTLVSSGHGDSNSVPLPLHARIQQKQAPYRGDFSCSPRSGSAKICNTDGHPKLLQDGLGGTSSTLNISPQQGYLNSQGAISCGQTAAAPPTSTYKATIPDSARIAYMTPGKECLSIVTPIPILTNYGRFILELIRTDIEIDTMAYKRELVYISNLAAQRAEVIGRIRSRRSLEATAAPSLYLRSSGQTPQTDYSNTQAENRFSLMGDVASPHTGELDKILPRTRLVTEHRTFETGGVRGEAQLLTKRREWLEKEEERVKGEIEKLLVKIRGEEGVLHMVARLVGTCLPSAPSSSL